MLVATTVTLAVLGLAGFSDLDGARNLRRRKAEARANRLNELHLQGAAGAGQLQPSARKELHALLQQDSYDPSDFGPAHKEFKAAHNAMFVTLASLCGGSGSAVFYLDGSDGASTTSLQEAGFDVSQLFVANMFSDTCDRLREPPLSLTNVEHSRAEVALAPGGAFAGQPFAALYLDGCGGAVEPLAAMLEALFEESRRSVNPRRLAVGFTLTEAEPSGRSLSDREQDVVRAAVRASAAQRYTVFHVGDDPWHWGVDPVVRKKVGSTLTSWLVCDRVERRG